MNSTCEACGESAVPAFEARDINRKISGESFKYFRCKGCGFLFLDPIPRDLGRYYPAGYYGSPPETEESLAGAAAAVEGYKLDFLKQAARGSGKRVLEIGPSMGGFAVLAKRAGFEVEVIEMDLTCCEFLAN